MKQCTDCGATKDRREFSKHSKAKDGLNWKCKECACGDAAEWRRNNPSATKKYNLAKYGMTISDWDAMLAEQNGRCAICGVPEAEAPGQTGSGSGLHVDHDHETGAVRGLLCRCCNLGLGQFFDDEEKLFNAIQYLRDHKQIK